jgi:serine/threonine protein kinase
LVPDRPDPPTASYRSSSSEAEAGSTESGRRARANHLVGTVLMERFELTKLLGIGAFGEVYQALDRQNPKSAQAVKILRRPSAQALYRFKREFRALGEWSHPNLVSLHELFLDRELAFFSMELVAGVDFHSFVRPGGHLNKERLFTATLGLCEGVSALHDRGRLHRDLKPANVLVEASGRAVIVDLGLATLFGRGAAVGSEAGFIGTVQYAAPEQLAGGAVGPETDWYAVGIMLYEALSGALPYDAAFAEQLRHKSHPPPPLALVGDDLDPLRRVCVELLSPDKRARPAARELRTALGSYARPATVTEPSFVGRERERAQLAELFREVEQGASRVALVSAPSGLGKTALVERFLRDLSAEHRATVLRGRCYVNEEVTYQAVDGSIDALSHHLSNLPRSQVAALLPRDVRSLAFLFPVLSRVEAIASAPPVRSLDDKASLRERAALALRELVGRLSDRLPVVLFIDDIQWDDEDSAWLMSRLLAAPDPPAVMLVATCRAEVRSESYLLTELLSETSTARLVHEISLPALSAEETASLAAQASETVLSRPELAERIALESGGHPLFALELARFLHTSEDEQSATSRLSLDAALQSRADQLSEPARRLLEIVCVAGRPLKYQVALSAAACEVDAVREVMTSKLVSISGTARYDTLSIYHDRIRDSELSALPTERVCALHALLAEALAADEQRFDLIVEHYLAAGQRDKAASYALRAADHAAAVLAFHRLPALLLLAIDAAAENERSSLYLRLAEGYALLGQRGAAAEAYQKAAELEPDPEQRWELTCLAMWQAFHAQDLKRGFAHLHALDRALGKERLRLTWLRMLQLMLYSLRLLVFGPPQLATEAAGGANTTDKKRLRLAFRAYSALIATEGEYTAWYAIEALRLSARLGDRTIYAATLAAFATFMSMRSGRRSKRADQYLARAKQLADEQADLDVRRWVESCELAYCFSCGEPSFDRFLPLMEGEFPATPFGTFLRSLLIYTMSGSVMFWTGHFALARTRGAHAIALARELADPLVENGLRTATSFRLLVDDEHEMAWQEWAATRERYPDHAALRQPTSGMVIALYQGRLDRAALVFRTAARMFWRWEAHFATGRHGLVWWWGALAAARIVRGERSLGLKLRLALACFLTRLRPPPLTAPLGIALSATRAVLMGEEARGIRLLEQAKLQFDAVDLRMFSACASYGLSRLHPDPARADYHALQAREVFEAEKLRCPEKWVDALIPGLLTPSGDTTVPRSRV